MARWSLALLAACGRVGFDGAGDDSSTDAVRVDVPGTGGDGSIGIDGPPGSVTYTFGEAPAAMFKNVTRDTFITNDATQLLFNYGADKDLRIERDVGERGLIAFDLTMLPSGATVLSATLEITLFQVPAISSTVTIHRMLESWDEGNESGAAGVANYVTRTGASSWSSAGAGEPSEGLPLTERPVLTVTFVP